MTRHLLAGLACAGLLVIGVSAFARSGAEKETAYVALLRLRWDIYAHWKETGRFEPDSAAGAALDGHVAFWNRERDEGRAILAGAMRGDYWDNVALIVFRAPSDSAANALVARDPAVKDHVFQAQVRGFDVFWNRSLAPPRD
jgi:uncharacterized protein YciI